VILVVGCFFGVDPRQLIDIAQQAAPPPQSASARTGPVEDPMAHFVAQALGSTEHVWTRRDASPSRT
jgi:predicted metalloprotease